MESTFNQEALNQANVDIAVLKVAMENRDKEIERLTDAVERLTARVESVSATLNEAKGGWRVLMMVGGAAGALGGAATWLINHVTLRG